MESCILPFVVILVVVVVVVLNDLYIARGIKLLKINDRAELHHIKLK